MQIIRKLLFIPILGSFMNKTWWHDLNTVISNLTADTNKTTNEISGTTKQDSHASEARQVLRETSAQKGKRFIVMRE